MDLNTTCKEYDLCTPETRAELAANGFDFTVCKFGITEFIAGRMKTGFIVETNGAIPYPTFTEVWRLLPPKVTAGNGNILDKYILENRIGYTCDSFNFEVSNKSHVYTNICDMVCLLWIDLKKGGFLNG